MQLDTVEGPTALQTAGPLVQIGDDSPCFGSGLTVVFRQMRAYFEIDEQRVGTHDTARLPFVESIELKTGPPFAKFRVGPKPQC